MAIIDKKKEMGTVASNNCSDYVRVVNSDEEKKQLKIEKIRKYLLRRLSHFKGVIKLDDFTEQELDEILFNYRTIGKKEAKSFALPIEVLRKIDMSNVSFKDFYARGVDFSELTGVRIDPNQIYDRYYCDVNFSGVKFLDEVSSAFLEGCKFAGSENAVIGDDVRYGGANNFADVTFKAPITSGILNDSNFAGSKGAVIELGEGKVSLIMDCCLKDATIKGNLIGCIIKGADFRGASTSDNEKIELYPEKIAPEDAYASHIKNFSDCHFAGVKFMGPIAGKNLYKMRGADFTGSEGAIIYPDIVFDYDYRDCKLAGVSFIPDMDIVSANLEGADFTGSVGAVINNRQGSIANANLSDTAIRFTDPDVIFDIYGINSATYNGKKFKTVFKDTIAKDYDDPIKTYTKKINAAIVKASE